MYILLGEKLGEISHEKFGFVRKQGSFFYDIAIRGEKMVVACGRQGVLLFNINK